MKKMNPLRTMTVSDIFLLCFLILFLAQIAFGLITDSFLSPQTASIDIVIRTFASSIVGYFLSRNFTAAESGSLPAYGTISDAPSSSSAATPQSKIGFSDTGSEKMLAAPAQTVSRQRAQTMQTYIVSGIGLVSLVLILILRNTMPITDSMVAPLTQLRDMLSSSVGYLVGSHR